MLLPYVYRNGVIVFRNRMPDRSLPITGVRHPKLLETVKVLARRSYPDPKTGRVVPLLPGIPEARTEQEAYRALIRFKREVERRLRPHNKKQVRRA